MVNTIRRKQKNWIGHVLRGDPLLRTVLEGRMKGKKVPGRPRTMMLDWMKDKNRGYREVKEKANEREEWQHWTPDLPEKAENQKKKNTTIQDRF